MTELLTISDEELVELINKYSPEQKSIQIALQNMHIKLQIAEADAARKEKILVALNQPVPELRPPLGEEYAYSSVSGYLLPTRLGAGFHYD